MEESNNNQIETGIDDTIENIESTNAVENEGDVVTQDEDIAHDESSDIEEAGETPLPVFEREGWTETVDKFEENFPVASTLRREIGETILEDEHLWEDENCLERALLKVLCDKYTPDSVKATDEEFLENYIYDNEDIRSHIVDGYVESLDRHRMPSTITRGGRISLASPARPRSITEAGHIAEKIMKR